MTAKGLINTDISKMSELELKTMITRILAGVEKKHRIPSAEIKEVRSSQDEIKNAMIETQPRIDATALRMDEAEK